MKLDNRVAIVTGAAAGIGRECAMALAGEGAAVVLADVDGTGLGLVADELTAAGRIGMPHQCDVSDPDQVTALAESVTDGLGRIDILVNGAIRRAGGPLESLPLESWDALIAVGLRGYFLVAQAVGRQMIRQRSGVIINIASTGGHTPYPGAGAYSVAKAGTIMLAKLMALEWAQYGIRACSISPGMVRTPMTEHLYADPETLAGRSACVPLGRIGQAAEVASVAAFLASDDASYITGADFLVDGGFVPSKFMHVPGRHKPLPG